VEDGRLLRLRRWGPIWNAVVDLNSTAAIKSAAVAAWRRKRAVV